jgi:hypothetical protein
VTPLAAASRREFLQALAGVAAFAPEVLALKKAGPAFWRARTSGAKAATPARAWRNSRREAAASGVTGLRLVSVFMGSNLT